MLRHHVVINVSDTKGKRVNVLRGGDIKLRDRILNFLLGKEQKMLVLVPSANFYKGGNQQWLILKFLIIQSLEN